MSILTCLRRIWCLKKEKKLDKVEKWALLSADHAIVYMDATEDDLMGETEYVNQIQDVLGSEAAQVIDEGTKKMLKDYLDAKTRTVAQRNIMDTININSKGVAQDVIQILDVGQRQSEMEHLLGSVINPLTQTDNKQLPEKEEKKKEKTEKKPKILVGA